MTLSSFSAIEMEVVRWGEARGIIQNGKPIGQAIKTLEEVTELLDAINRGDCAETQDAVGDVMVTLAMVCAILDLDMTRCFAAAYEQIKDRRGYLRPDGVFVKEQKTA